MAGRYLLDTNGAIGLLNDVVAVKELIADARVFLSPTVLGELRYGAEKSARPLENHDRIDGLAARCPELACGGDVALEYGRIKNQLSAIGRPIPDNDIWIAATAVHHRAALATNGSHFDYVDGLEVIGWQPPG